MQTEQIELCVGAKKGGSELPTLHNKRHEGEWLARWMDTGTWQEWKTQKGRLKRKSEACLRLWWYKSPRVPLSEIPPERHQPRLFLCYYTVKRLLYGKRCPRPGVKPVRKPGLTASQVCRESSGAPVRSLELPAVKELWSQKLKSLVLGEWLSESPVNGQTGKFP